MAVAYALRPDDFAHGDPEPPDAPGEPVWHVPELDLSLWQHPDRLLDPDDRALLLLWRAWRRGTGGMGGGVGHLPFAGGTADQPACVMAALTAMDAMAEAMRPKGKDG